MKKVNFVFVLALFFIAAAAVSAYASSCEKGNYHSKSAHKFKKHFPDMDTDKNGSLSFEEFKAVFPRTEKKAFERLDTDKNGSLSHDEWHEFKHMHGGMGKHQGKGYHKKKYHGTKLPDPAAFNAHFPDMDKDGNDRVSLEEFKAFFPDASDHEAVFKAIDLDGKGSLDHDEWHEFKAAHGLKHVD